MPIVNINKVQTSNSENVDRRVFTKVWTSIGDISLRSCTHIEQNKTKLKIAPNECDDREAQRHLRKKDRQLVVGLMEEHTFKSAPAQKTFGTELQIIMTLEEKSVFIVSRLCSKPVSISFPMAFFDPGLSKVSSTIPEK